MHQYSALLDSNLPYYFDQHKLNQLKKNGILTKHGMIRTPRQQRDWNSKSKLFKKREEFRIEASFNADIKKHYVSGIQVKEQM